MSEHNLFPTLPPTLSPAAAWKREICAEHSVTTYHDADAEPPWIATSGTVTNLLNLHNLENPPVFAAVGATELEAIAALAEKNGWPVHHSLPIDRREHPNLVNLHQVRRLLRHAYLHNHTLHDLAILLSLLSHHPRWIRMQLIRDETGIARQTAYRALTWQPDLIEQVDRPTEKTRGHGAALFYRLTPAGVRVAADYLRLLL